LLGPAVGVPMPYFRSTESLYAALRETFRHIEQESPDHLDGLKGLMAARMVIKLRCTAPPAEVTLNGRERPFKASYRAPGPSASIRESATLRADLTVELEADTLHLVLLDALSIKKALADGKIKVLGPAWKLKVLIDLIKAARAYYPGVLRVQGLM
jgi:hypothetical protein